MSNAIYSTHLRGLDLRQLLEAARYVRDLQGQPGWVLLQGLIEIRWTALETQLLNTALPSHEKFAQIQGEMRGLRALTEAADSVLEIAQEREAQEQALAEAASV